MVAGDVIATETEDAQAKSDEQSHASRLDETGLVLALAGVVGFGLVGMAAAVVGIFRPLVVLPVGTAVWAMILALWGPRLRGPAIGSRAPRRWWVAAAVFVAAVTVWNAHFSAEHAFADRDPGIYLNTALWLASEHRLEIGPVRVPPRFDRWLSDEAPGLYGADGETKDFQFLHLLPVLQATASWIGGDFALTRTSALIAGLALITVFALATTLVRSSLAFVAIIALGLNIAFVYTARDSHSEPLMLLLVAGGMWLLARSLDVGSPRRAAVAGLVFGSAATARVDFPVYAIGLVAFLAIVAIRRRVGPGNDGPHREIPAFAVGLAPGLALGLADASLRSPHYVGSVAGLPRLVLLGLASAVTALVVVRFWGALSPLRRLLAGQRARLALAAGLGVVALGVFALLVRPELFPERDSGISGPLATHFSQMQAEEHFAAIDPQRTFSEQSLRWLSWYLGFPCVVLGVLGVALASYRLVSGRAGRGEALLLLLAITPLVLTIARPSITSDHPWVSRRFVVLAMPAMVMFAVLSVDLLVRSLATARRGPQRPPIAVAAGAVMIVAFPVTALAPVAGHRPYADVMDALRLTCERAGPTAAFVVLAPVYNDVLPLPLRTVCGVPAVALTRPLSTGEIHELSRAFARQGRQLWLAGSELPPLYGIDRQFEIASPARRRIEDSLTKRPNRLVPESHSFLIGRVGTHVGTAAALTGVYDPEPQDDGNRWHWVGRRAGMTVTGDGRVWLSFRAASFGRNRVLRLRAGGERTFKATVRTSPGTYLIGPLHVRTQEDLEIVTDPGPERPSDADPRELSVWLTDPVALTEPIAAVPEQGFRAEERDASAGPVSMAQAARIRPDRRRARHRHGRSRAGGVLAGWTARARCRRQRTAIHARRHRPGVQAIPDSSRPAAQRLGGSGSQSLQPAIPHDHRRWSAGEREGVSPASSRRASR